ncbi:MAG: CoA-binding protein [Gammaproteobacteria bacterium]|nr:CoA-binding protein [Gammaproteobacteria bacterium]
MSEMVAIIGASEKKNRFAYKAMLALREHGHDVKLVNPFKETIEGHKCFKAVSDIKEKINTVTLYVNARRFRDHIDEVVQAKPERVIMNPGTEDVEMQAILEDAGIEVFRACTLVLLSSGRF